MKGKIDAKKIRLRLKKNKGMSQLCAEMACSEDEMLEAIRSVYKKKKKIAEDIITELKDNDKKNARRHHNEVEAVVEPAEEVATCETIDVTEEATELQVETLPLEEIVDGLKKTEHEQSEKAMGLESQHKKLASERRELFRKMRDIRSENRELWGKIVKNKDLYESIANESNELGNSMNEISKDLRDVREALENTRAEIDALNVVEIFVYTDGRIENEVGVELDDSGSDEVYRQLLEDERAQNLRLNAIRTLAKVVKIVEHLSADTVVIFEDDEVDEVYYAMKETENEA